MFDIPLSVVFLVATLQVAGSVTSEVLWGEDGRLIYFWGSTTVLCAWMFLHIHKKAQASKTPRVPSLNAEVTPVKVRVILPGEDRQGSRK